MTERALSLSLQGGPAEELLLTNERAVLGRSSEADTQIDDPSISRSHAKITQTSTGWMLGDLGSSHGTFLNNLRLSEGELTRVHDGDNIGMMNGGANGGALVVSGSGASAEITGCDFDQNLKRHIMAIAGASLVDGGMNSFN